MAIPVACVCGHEWPDLEGFEGQLVNCPRCGNTLRVPGKPRQFVSGRFARPAASARTAAPETPAQETRAPETRTLETRAPPTRATSPSVQPAPAPKPFWKSAPSGSSRTKAGLAEALEESRLQAGALTLVARYKSGLRERAEELLLTLAGLPEKGWELAEDLRIPFGWLVLTLRVRGEEGFVCAPDFARNPFDQVQEDLSLALSLAAAQSAAMRKAGIRKPMPCLFTDEIQVAKGCLDHKLICMQRRDFPTRGKSGWRIGPGDPADIRRANERKSFEGIPSYRLLGRREILLHLLPLPVNYTAHIEGDAVQGVLDPNEEQVWGRL